MSAVPSSMLPDPDKESEPSGRPARARWLRRAMLGAIVACALCGIAVAAGFWWFVWSVPTEEVALDRNADGIVVLTGGASRVIDAMELLSEGRGRRLLITGVHRATSSAEIARLNSSYGRLMRCCVDLDHSAVNTVGNAIETRRWAQRRQIRSLIVVTSNYHMPRAMAELARQLPDVTLIAFPVVTDKMRADRWWSAPTARLLLTEYLKFIVAQLRMRIEPAFAAEGAAAAPRVAQG